MHIFKREYNWQKEFYLKCLDRIQNHWCQNATAQDSNGTPVDVCSSEATSWCSAGVIDSYLNEQFSPTQKHYHNTFFLEFHDYIRKNYKNLLITQFNDENDHETVINGWIGFGKHKGFN